LSDEKEILDPVEKAKERGVFNIADVVRGRTYPSTEIDVFIDEEIAYTISQLDGLISKTSESLDKKSLSKKETDDILKRREEIMEKKDKMIAEMGGSKYVFHIRGISEGDRQDIFDSVLEKFPYEYEKSRNPFTGAQEKVEVESKERDRYFTDRLWQAHISKIVAPDGSEQNSITFDDAVELRRNLPLASISKVTEAIEKIRVSTAVFMMTVDEDFLAKS